MPWDLTNGSISGAATAVAAPPDRLAVAKEDGVVSIFRVSPVGTITHSPGELIQTTPSVSISFSRNGEEILSVTTDGNVYEWTTLSDSRLPTPNFTCNHAPKHVVFSTNHQFALFCSMREDGIQYGECSLYHISRQEQIRVLPLSHFNFVNRIQFTPDENCLLLGGISQGKSLLRLYCTDDLAYRRPIGEITRSSQGIGPLCFSNDGKRLLIGRSIVGWDSTAEDIDPNVDEVRMTYPWNPKPFDSVTFATDDHELYLTGLRPGLGAISVYDSTNGRLSETLIAEELDRTFAPLFLQNSTVMITRQKDGCLRIWRKNK